MGRQYIGININPGYINSRRSRFGDSGRPWHEPLLLVGRATYPGKEELAEMAAADAAGTSGKDAEEKKHKRKTYERKVEIKEDEQLKFV